MIYIITILCLISYVIVICVTYEVEFFMGQYRPVILSPHETHKVLKTKMPKFPFKTVIRMGYKWFDDTIFKCYDVEINSVESIRNSADKLRMKLCFEKLGVKTAKFWMFNESVTKFPVIAKHRFGSRGTGNYKLDNRRELKQFVNSRKDDLEKFIFEQYKPFDTEFRIHVYELGYFYTCRKALKSNVYYRDRWKFNYNNCVWLREGNEKFNKPRVWDLMVKESVKALKSVKLDVGAVDIKYDPKTEDFFIIEINSAPSFQEVTASKYLEFLPKIINNKYNG